MKSFLASFRGRLTLISLATLAMAMTVYSLLLGYVNVTRLSQHIDQELFNRARQITSRPGPPPRVRGDLEMRPRDGGPTGMPDAGPGDSPFDPQGPDLRRPRLIDETGKTLSGDDPLDPALVQSALRGREGFAEIKVDGQPVRVFAAPWRRPDGSRGAVEVARDLRDIHDLKQTQFWTWLALTPLALALAAFAAFVLTGRALVPLKAMRQAAHEIGAGDLKQRLAVQGDDELAELALAFNAMAANLDRSFKEMKEAYESQKRFTADASHELRTPLARLQLATSSALRGDGTEYRSALETADASAKKMAGLIRDLLMLARADAGQLGLRRDHFDLRLPVSDALNAFDREIRAEFPPGPLSVVGDQDHLERVVSNLVENAIRHTPEGKAISVRVAPEPGSAAITISDEGSGIAPEHLPHLFERFYRADASRTGGDGVGLGLAICKSVVEAHGGTIEVQSEPGKGTCIKIQIPLASS